MRFQKGFQAGWNIFEVTWLILTVCFIATGISLGRRFVGGNGGALIGAIGVAMVGIISVTLVRFLLSVFFRRFLGSATSNTNHK